MTDDTRHYTSEQLAAWVRREMVGDEVPGLELHLAACDECAFRARAEYDLSTSSAGAHAAAQIAAAAREALLSAARRMPAGAAEKLAAWVHRGMDHLSGLLRVVGGQVMDMPGIGSDVLRELTPVLRGVQDGSSVARKLAVIQAGEPGPDGRSAAEVYLLERGLVVQFPTVLREQTPPRPFLLALDNPAASVELELKWSDQMNMWGAVISNPPRDFCIIIGPALDSRQ